jgi:hypothetical protein
MMLNVTFLVREVCQSLHTTRRWGEVFVGYNLLCYFGEQSVADGLTPNPILDDGKYILTALIEEEIATFTLTNTFDSSEILVDSKPSGNGFWLSDRPQGIQSGKGAKLSTALQFSDSENLIDAAVISWTLGNVVHLDAQSASVPHSGGKDRVSPDLTLNDQWDFDGLKFGDSGTLAFKVGDSVGNDVNDTVTMLRIEYHLKSNLADATKINFKLNELNTIVGTATDSEIELQQRICMLITHPQLEPNLFEPESRQLKHTIATDGATIAIERIRLSYYRPDPIVTWEIDGQLTRLRLRNTNFNQVPAGSVPIRWELLSGKPVDISVLLLSWYHGYHGAETMFNPELRIFHTLRDLSSPIVFDHGTGTGRDGVLELVTTDVVHPNVNGPLFPDDENPIINLTGVYIAPENNQSNRFRVRDEVRLNGARMFTDEMPVGSIRPVGVSEADAIGFSTLPGVYFGTGEYLALRPIRNGHKRSPAFCPDFSVNSGPRYLNKSCQIMMDDTFLRLISIAGFGDSIENLDSFTKIKVIKAWVSPDEIENEENEWAHAQGRAVDFIAIEVVTLNRTHNLM